MVSLRFALLAVTLLAVVSAYGPPKKGAVPPNPEKYETDEKSLKKGDELDKAPEDVLYVKGQPVEGGKGEDLIDESFSYGGEKKIKEVKVEETSIDLGGGGYGGKPKSGKKSYGGDESYTKEVVKEVKYDDKGKFGPEEGKFEEVKEETKLDKGYGGAGGYGGEVIKEIKEEKQIKKYGGKGGYGGGGYGGGSKKEIIKEDNYGAPPKGSEGGYLIPDDSKAVYPEPDVPKESYGDKGPKGGDFGGYGKQEGKKGGYGAEEKFEESKEGAFGGKALGPKGGYGGEDKYGKEEGFEGKGPKGGYGGESPKGPKGGYGKGGYGEEKIEEKIEENFKEEGAGYGGGKPLGPKGGYGKGGYGKEKIEEKIEENFKEEGAGYGGGKPLGPKGGYGKGGIVEEKIEETYKEGGSYGGGKPKGDYGGGYGGDKKVIEETKEIKTEYGGDSYGGGKKLGGGYGGGYGGEKKFDEGYGPKPGESFTTLSTKSCNKLMDGLFGKLQNSFTGHMSQIKMDKFSPVQIGGWARVRLYDGKMDNIGKICRGGDFQVLPQGENIIIRGTITVPEPKAKFCGDAYLYNRLKVRNRNLMLCAKDASFRMQMIINKRVSKVDVDELEPIGMHGFHVEDDKGLKSDALAWPFNKIRDTQLTKQKYQLMSTLQHKLCDDFRQIVAKPEIKEEILRLV